MALSADSEYKVAPGDPRIPPDGDTANIGTTGNTIKYAVGAVALMVLVSGAWIGFGDQIAGIFASDEEDVPTITADPAPIKVKPESPGGMNVPNQGRLVYGMVDGTAAQPRVERLLPAGEKPVAVEEVLTRSVPEANQVVTGAAPRGTADTSSPVRLVPESQDSGESNAPAPVAESPPAPVAPAPPPSAKPTEVASATPAVEPKPVAPAAPAPVAEAPKAPAPKPQPKPVARATPAPTPAPAAAVGDLSKSYRVQLAAARSENAVKSEWDKLQRRNTDLLGELDLQVTRIDLGSTKGVFYRLRAGPISNAAKAKALCERLKQRKLGCLVVKPGK